MIDILSIGYIIRRGNDWWCGAKDICLSSCGWIMVSSTDQEEVDAVLKNVSNLIFAGEHLLGLHTWGERHRREGSILARVCSNEREKDSGLNLVQKRLLSERALEILINMWIFTIKMLHICLCCRAVHKHLCIRMLYIVNCSDL